MKKVNKILMSCVIAIITLHLIGCKDDEYWYDNVSPQWIAFYEREILSSEVINKYDMFYAIYKSPDTKVDCKILIGTTKGNMIELTDQDYKIEPFSQYMVTYNPYIIHNKDTVFGEEKTMKAMSQQMVDF